ncbi:MAG: single-stranded DNA-binding protein [Aeromicrobium sp.]
MNNNDNIVTLYGHVGTAIELREGASVPWAMFRVGSTPRWYDAATRTWKDHETTWMTVKVFRSLAQNVAESLKVGDPVVVIGKLRTQSWTTKEGEARQSEIVEAHVVSHDLNRGITRYARVERQPQAQAGPDADVEVLETLVGQTPTATAA